jgi:hypothetical protein
LTKKEISGKKLDKENSLSSFISFFLNHAKHQSFLQGGLFFAPLNEEKILSSEKENR